MFNRITNKAKGTICRWVNNYSEKNIPWDEFTRDPYIGDHPDYKISHYDKFSNYWDRNYKQNVIKVGYSDYYIYTRHDNPAAGGTPSHDKADMLMFQGVYVGYVALDQENNTKERLLRAVNGLLDFHNIGDNGKHGLYRGFDLDGSKSNPDPSVSGSQLSGYLFGLTLAWIFGDGSVRQEIRQRFIPWVDQYIKDSYKVRDYQGKVGDFGNANPSILSNFPGHTSIPPLVFALAFEVTKNPDYKHELNNLLDLGYDELIKEDPVRFLWIGKFYHYHIAIIKAYAAIHLDSMPKQFVDAYKSCLDNCYRFGKDTGNVISIVAKSTFQKGGMISSDVSKCSRWFTEYTEECRRNRDLLSGQKPLVSAFMDKGDYEFRSWSKIASAIGKNFKKGGGNIFTRSTEVMSQPVPQELQQHNYAWQRDTMARPGFEDPDQQGSFEGYLDYLLAYAMYNKIYRD